MVFRACISHKNMVIHSYNSILVPQLTNSVSRQANDAASQSSTPELPPPPFSHDSTSTSTPSTAVIDLAPPTNASRQPTRRGLLVDAIRPGLSRTRRSDDEKRLVGDYRYNTRQGLRVKETESDSISVHPQMLSRLQILVAGSKVPVLVKEPCIRRQVATQYGCHVTEH